MPHPKPEKAEYVFLAGEMQGREALLKRSLKRNMLDMNPIGIHSNSRFEKNSLTEVCFRRVLRALNVINDKKLMLTSKSTK